MQYEHIKTWGVEKKCIVRDGKSSSSLSNWCSESLNSAVTINFIKRKPKESGSTEEMKILAFGNSRKHKVSPQSESNVLHWNNVVQ